MDKVEPERLQRSIPQFKPWISSTSWDHWEHFLNSELPTLARPTDLNIWPLLTIKAASNHCEIEEIREDLNVEGAQVIEEMLDKERIAVEVTICACNLAYSCMKLFSDNLEGLTN